MSREFALCKHGFHEFQNCGANLVVMIAEWRGSGCQARSDAIDRCGRWPVKVSPEWPHSLLGRRSRRVKFNRFEALRAIPAPCLHVECKSCVPRKQPIESGIGNWMSLRSVYTNAAAGRVIRPRPAAVNQ